MRYVDYFGTLGPACSDVSTLQKLFSAGMTGVRLNLSHSSLPECEEWIHALDEASKDHLVKRKLLIDLQGPELRIGVLKQPLLLEEGKEVLLTEPYDEVSKPAIPVPKQVLWALRRGNRVLLDDGKIMLEVYDFVSRNDEQIEEEQCPTGGRIACRIIRGGVLNSRKSIAVKGCKIDLPTLTAADIRNLGMARQYGVTGVMLPFVRNRQDLVNLRNALRQASCETIKIYAKIENEDGVEQLETLLDACDEVVIARGDLGNSVSLCRLPSIQEQIAITCRQHQKKYMVVTQMLASMERSAVPTRAEVSDIYHAIRQGASSLMLTGETAVGDYPVEAMQVLVATARTALER